jgi:predicted nuclease of predicted toxin-antitoxin system
MRFLGLRDAEDLQIFDAAKQVGDTVIISKDSDFIELVVQRGIPPRLIWVTCGNLTNRRLREVFLKLFPEALRLLRNGEIIVELGDAN